jgi:Arc/MetJ family transcription regulator
MDVNGDMGMATNPAIDDNLIEEALVLGGQKTKKAVVTKALKEYIQRRKQKDILNIFGKVDYDQNYAYKKQRQAE